MLKKNIITAQDLDYDSKLKEVELKVFEYNKKRARRAIKDFKAVNDNQIEKDDILRIKNEIENDTFSKQYRDSLVLEINNEMKNYDNVRKNIENLNDIWFDSVEVEKCGIQKIDEFLDYDSMIIHSVNNIEQFKNLKQLRINEINDYKKNLVNDGKDLAYESIGNILKLREMYQVSTDTDDFEIFEKFGTESNIEIANKLSDIFFQIKEENFINMFNEDYDSKRFNNQKQKLNQLVTNNIVSNRMLGILFSNKFISNNQVTTLHTAFTNNTNFEYVYRTRTLGELLLEITNTDLTNEQKANRQQIYMSYDTTRPEQKHYHKWNGLQVYDLDLKYWVQKCGGSIDNLKNEIHKLMINYHWYLWICTSASGNGLHIYTKVTPPHHIHNIAKDNEYLSFYWHQVNYLTKLSNIYDVLNRLHYVNGNNINFSQFWYKERGGEAIMVRDNNLSENMYVDNIVSRITAGIRLSYDIKPLINHNFVDMHVGWNLGQTLDGYDYIETINKTLLRYSKLKEKIDQNLVSEKVESEIDLSQYVTLGTDLSDVKPIPKNSINYIVRYNVCNTLAALFGKDGIQLAHQVLDSKGCKNEPEINAFYGCAISNGKEPSKIGLEILKKIGILKSINPEFVEELADNYKGQLKQQIEKSLTNKLVEPDFKLTRNQYLSDIEGPLTEAITGEKVTIIFSPAGSGKTEFIKRQALSGKRIMLVLPYISVIKNKIETDTEISKLFDTFYGTADIKDIQPGRNIVTTFDKFSRSNYEKLSRMFDYVYIDESHLLFTSSYRIEATSNAIKKIKELFYISSNDPYSAKMVLMTGTETGEVFYFKEFANIIRVSKPYLNKELEFLVCGDTLDSLTRLASKAAQLLRDDYRLMIPTNKGEIYSEKIIGMIEYLLDRPIKYGYYKRSNTEQEICRLIDEHNSIGDYDIVFCSNYLSVGVDINDKHKFASLYLGNFSGYEIEQFNARIRKTGIKSIYCIHTSTSDGTTNEVLLQEPDLILKVTDEDKLLFIDDKSIASAKTEFIATYDPVLHKITTPGFSLFQGKIQFNLEEYELVSFENKYSVCMEHPIKVARELSKYGYKITVSNEFDGLDPTEQETLKKMGIEAAKQEKIRKHNLLVGTYVDLINQNTFSNEHGLEFTGVIEWIGKHTDCIIEDRELTRDVKQLDGSISNEPCYVHVIFDVFATPTQVIVRSREAFEKMYRPAKYIVNRYSKVRALEIIYKYVDDNGILKQKNFQRAINLLKLIDSSDANEMSEPISKTLEKMYDFVDKFETSKDFRIGYENYQATLDQWVAEYIDLLGIKVNTKYGWDKIKDGILEMLQDLATKQQGKAGIRFTYNRLPDQDSSNILNRRSIDTIVSTMFNITETIITNKKQIRDKHIILTQQNF